MFLNRRQFLLGGGTTIASPFVCKANGEKLTDIELILALDASGSVFMGGEPHWVVQIKGHIYALEHPKVREQLISSSTYLRIVTWSDNDNPVHEQFSRRVLSPSDCNQAIQVLSQALDKVCYEPFCANTRHHWLIEKVCALPRMGYRRVLDVSTDQVPIPTSYTELRNARELFHTQDGTINALAVKMDEEGKSALRSQLCSPHGFCIGADKDSEYAEALARKIIAEIA
jgi:hypothetical protein